MRISVAIAVRNGERYLQPLLDSLLRQTAAPFEVVVAEDASEDATPAILEAFAADAPFPVRIERFPERRGHVEGFLHAARLCEGDAVAFCDADDVWRDEKLEVCGRELGRTGAALVMHTARAVDADLRDLGYDWPVVGPTRTVPPLGLTGLGVHAPTMAMVFPRNLLDRADFETRPPSRYGLGRRMLNDEWVIFLAGVLGPIRLLNEALVLYRRHGENDSAGPLVARRERTLRPAVGNYRGAAEHTRACAEYLDSATSDDPAVAARLAAGARHYRRAAENWERRVALYRATDRRSRVRAVRRLLGAGAYGARPAGGFGRAALAKDVAAGVGLRLTGTADDD